jgi:hypothetical protein
MDADETRKNTVLTRPNCNLLDWFGLIFGRCRYKFQPIIIVVVCGFPQFFQRNSGTVGLL